MQAQKNALIVTLRAELTLSRNFATAGILEAMCFPKGSPKFGPCYDPR